MHFRLTSRWFAALGAVAVAVSIGVGCGPESELNDRSGDSDGRSGVDPLGDAAAKHAQFGGEPACGDGDPDAPSQGHGYEKGFNEGVVGVCRRAIGCESKWGTSKPDLSLLEDGTPNHKLLLRVWYYGWAYEFGTAADRSAAHAEMLHYLALEKLYGHQAVKESGYDSNEILTTSHYQLWANGMACVHLLARVNKDAPMLAATGSWWRGEAALYKLLARNGSIDAPGTRFYPGTSGGPDQLRDVIYAMIVDTPLPKPANQLNGVWWSQFYNSAAWMLREIYRSGDDLGGASAATNADLPKLRDDLQVWTRGSDWVYEFPSMHGVLNPLFWVAHIDGKTTYAPIVAGTPQTSSVPAPSLAGGKLFVVPGLD